MNHKLNFYFYKQQNDTMKMKFVKACERYKSGENRGVYLYDREFLARARRSRCITLQDTVFCMSVMSFKYRIVSENRPSALQKKNI